MPLLGQWLIVQAVSHLPIQVWICRNSATAQPISGFIRLIRLHTLLITSLISRSASPRRVTVVLAASVVRAAPVVFRSGVSAVPVVTPVRAVTAVTATPTARPVVTAVMVVPRAVVVPVVPAVRRGRVLVVWAGLVVTPGPRARVRPVPRVRPARSCRATAATVVPAVPAAPAAMVALLELAAYPLLLRAGPRARRARSAGRPMAAPLVTVVPAEPDSMPQVGLMALLAARVAPVVTVVRAV